MDGNDAVRIRERKVTKLKISCKAIISVGTTNFVIQNTSISRARTRAEGTESIQDTKRTLVLHGTKERKRRVNKKTIEKRKQNGKRPKTMK